MGTSFASMELGFQRGSIFMSLDAVAAYHYAKDLGSVLTTRYQHNALDEVIRAANDGPHLDYRRFVGELLLHRMTVDS